MLQPWLNPQLSVAISKKKKEEENKVTRIAKTNSKDKVDVLNLYDVMMKNAGIDMTKLKD